jgi:hypothetical protein
MKYMVVITQLKYSSDIPPSSVLFFTVYPVSPATLNSYFDPSEQSTSAQLSLLLQNPFNMDFP